MIILDHLEAEHNHMSPLKQKREEEESVRELWPKESREIESLRELTRYSESGGCAGSMRRNGSISRSKDQPLLTASGDPSAIIARN